MRDLQIQHLNNGMRHNDYLRYRHSCSKRLRKLYVFLKYKNSKKPQKKVHLPSDFSDMRWLQIPLVSAERAWSYGMQLKADNAIAATFSSKARRQSIRRFVKAAKWATVLESLSEAHAGRRTQLEAEAYAAFITAFLLVEREKWAEALEKILHCRKVSTLLSIASSAEESAFLSKRSEELIPLLQECKYHLEQQFDPDDPDGNSASAKKASKPRPTVSGLSHRGQDLATPSDEATSKLRRCLQLAGEVQAGEEGATASTTTKYKT